MEKNRITIVAPGGKLYGASYDLWDFPIEELLDGTVEINEDIWYWLIDGRCYETTEEVEA